MEEITKTYTNGEITIVWKPKTCSHSTKCWRGHESLVEVFNPKDRPWIKPENASSERIVEQIKKCPSGALSFYYNEDKTV
ncbi:MAG: (4Fe-4S)-binding protein [Bacteroidetes bacterium]|nr:(4Fe-4S)-binding protein [Bacteroidota bacterium]